VQDLGPRVQAIIEPTARNKIRGNTPAPCVIIGERMADILKA